MAIRAFPFAAVVLAPRATAADAVALANLLEAARAAGADPIIATVPRDVHGAPGARAVHVTAGASDSTALRTGMAQLGNSTARFMLLLRLGGGAADVVSLLALVDAAKRDGAALTAFAGDDLERGPLFVARDVWLDLMTLAEEGIGAVAARRGVHRVER